MELIIFDFCETLVNLQTADEFVFYVHRNNKLPWFNRFLFRIWTWLKKLKIFGIIGRISPDLNLEKKLLLWSLKGLSKTQIDSNSNSFAYWLKSRINDNIWNEFQRCLASENPVIICSGGYEEYLIPFFSEFNVEIIGTKMKFKGDQFSGKIEGIDCLGEEKVNRIAAYLGGKEKLNKTVIRFYSDSITDMPLFNYSKRRIVAYKSVIPGWAKNEKFETINW